MAIITTIIIGNDNDNRSPNYANKFDISSTLDHTLDSTLDGCCSFGDDTMHILMDAELRLSAMPPSSVKSSLMSLMAAGGTATKGGAGSTMGSSASMALGRMATADSTHWPSEAQQLADNDFERRDSFSNFNELAMQQQQQFQFQNNDSHNDSNMIMGGGNNNNVMMDSSMVSEEDGLSTGLSTGATSLLRGPIMAAKSAREEVTNSRTTSNNRAVAGMDDNDDTPSKARDEFLSAQKPMMLGNTPSAAREEFILSAQKQPSSKFQSSAAGMTANGRMMATTPSAARAEFLSSFQKMPPRPQLAQSTHGPGNYSRDGPGGNGRSEFIVSTQKQSQRHQSRNDNSPSAARDNFLTSPQDSVSTIGERSPSDGYNVMQPRVPATSHQSTLRQLTISEGGMFQHQQQLPPLSYPTPSVMRSKFVTSPQDSMPSVGSARVPSVGSSVGRSGGRSAAHRQQQQQAESSLVSSATSSPKTAPLSLHKDISAGAENELPFQF